jgi:hypothetical protein
MRANAQIAAPLVANSKAVPTVHGHKKTRIKAGLKDLYTQ